MEQKHTCASICDQLPTSSANHNHPWLPWMVDQSLEDYNRDHILYTTRGPGPGPLSQYKFQIPSFLGKRIRGCFYGWVILSNHPNNDLWSIWNPVTCKTIRLPPLILKDGHGGSHILEQCCLSSPPDDPDSIFMVTSEKYTIVFCLLDRKKLKWVEMSYAQQMRSIAGYDCFLYCLTCCNGKVYALNNARCYSFVIRIDIIVVKGREIVISLFPYLRVPFHYVNGFRHSVVFLKGCCTELFFIQFGINKRGDVEKKTIDGVGVFKLDMTNKSWEEMEDLKDNAFFLDPFNDYSVFYSPAIGGLELGGCIHFLDKYGKVTHSLDLKNKTIAFSSSSLFEKKEENDDEVDSNNNMTHEGEDDDDMESRLLNIPFDVLKMIMKFCVGIEYLNFRVTCKQCHLAAPMVRWNNKEGRLLQTYSLVSPWLMVLDKYRGIISFSDPVFGDKYFINTPQELIGDVEIHCSMGGWLLIRRHNGPLMFFNPFTSDIRELPFSPYLDTYCFSAPPTDPDCMVVGFTTRSKTNNVHIHFVARESSWREYQLHFCSDSYSFRFATIYRQNLYALYDNGGVGFIDTATATLYNTWNLGLPLIDIDDDCSLDYTWREGPPSEFSKLNFLMKCDQQLLLVSVGEFGECIEVFKMNNNSKEWEKTESLGRHTIYICRKACLCIEAKTPEMANKIYFPRFHSDNGKIVFYSLETKRYHTSNNHEESFEDFMGTKHHLDPHVWIEPTWS